MLFASTAAIPNPTHPVFTGAESNDQDDTLIRTRVLPMQLDLQGSKRAAMGADPDSIQLSVDSIPD